MSLSVENKQKYNNYKRYCAGNTVNHNFESIIISHKTCLHETGVNPKL